MLEQLYRRRVTRALVWLISRPWLTRLAGLWMDSRASKLLIAPFIRKNRVDMRDVLTEDWPSFNAFFTRRLVSGARVPDACARALISPCDGYLSVYPVTREGAFVVKGTPYTVETLTGDASLAARFLGGWCLSFRLTSADYHRYIFPDDGVISVNARVEGVFHTVRPYALGAYPVYKTNTREYTLLNTAHFGDVLFVEVGAMLVGRIVNIKTRGAFSRGEEKGRFEFGGSTVLMILEAGRVSLEPGILEDSALGRETRVLQGERVGALKTSDGDML